MKKYLSTCFLLIVVTSTFAQYEKKDIVNVIQALSSNIQNGDTMLVSNETLNNFFAKKLSYYLSGSTDLSLFNNYAVLDFGEDKAKIGWNINASKPNNRISDILTIGLQSAVSKNFSSLFSEKKFNNDIGLDLKYTHIFRGSIWFDNKNQKQQAPHALAPRKKSQLELMNQKRILMRALLQNEIDKGYKEYEDYLAALESDATVEAATVTEEKKVKFEALQKKITKLYYEYELEQLEDPGNNAYNKACIQWISLTGFIPVTKTTYSGTADITLTPGDLITRKWSAGISYNFMNEFRTNRVFFNLGFNIFRNNSVDAGKMEKLSLEKYKLLSSSGDTSLTANLKRDDVYLGAYETFWTPNLKTQLVFYPSWSSKIGVDLSLTKKFGKDQALDFILGFPIALTGQEEDKPVNIIVQIKMPDINNKNQPDVKFKDKLQVGFTVGLPFNSIIK
ncbi:MAG: hypothetical protein IPP72_06320 [Chitinophagaceae bacterium]|nr:hypothetical protein [Chitinophagaceae bacterium]